MPNGPARVLVVDDVPAMLTTCRAILRSLYGERVHVDAVTTGEAAMALVRAGPPYDLVLSDQYMGETSGVDLLEVVRKEQPTALRYLMTSQADLGLAVSALQRARIHGFIEKPAAPEELRSVLDGLLANAPRELWAHERSG